METPETSDAPGATSIDSDIAADAVSNAPLPDTPPDAPPNTAAARGIADPRARSVPSVDLRPRPEAEGTTENGAPTADDAEDAAKPDETPTPTPFSDPVADATMAKILASATATRLRRESEFVGGPNASSATQGRPVMDRSASTPTRPTRRATRAPDATSPKGRRHLEKEIRRLSRARSAPDTRHDRGHAYADDDPFASDGERSSLDGSLESPGGTTPTRERVGSGNTPIGARRSLRGGFTGGLTSSPSLASVAEDDDDGATWTDEDDDDDDESRSETDSIMPLPVKRSTHGTQGSTHGTQGGFGARRALRSVSTFLFGGNTSGGRAHGESFSGDTSGRTTRSFNTPHQSKRASVISSSTEPSGPPAPPTIRLRRTSSYYVAGGVCGSERPSIFGGSVFGANGERASREEREQRRRNELVRYRQRCAALGKLAVTTLAGTLAGMVLWAMTTVTAQLTKAKFDATRALLGHDSGALSRAWAFYCACAVTCIGLTAFGILHPKGAPMARGSGIPELKGYLNGNRQQGLFHWRTFVGRSVGICLVITATMPFGREGPSVHIGACAASVALNLPWKHYLGWQPSPEERRQILQLGSAAGVAAAFNAPIGGLLYVMEEVASNLPPDYVWRAFMTAGVAVGVALVLYSANEGRVDYASLVISDPNGSSTGWGVQDLPLVAILAALAGALSAAFTISADFFGKWRRNPGRWTPRFVRDAMKTRWGMWLDAVIGAALNASMQVLLPAAFGCRPAPTTSNEYGPDGSLNVYTGRRLLSDDGDSIDSIGDVDGDSSTDQFVSGAARSLLSSAIYIPRTFVQYTCDPGDFSEMATLMLQNEEGVVKHLFARDELYSERLFTAPVVFAFLAYFFFIASVTFGGAFPAGVFIPNMLMGASLGRLFGFLAEKLSPAVNKGTYALIGSAAMLSGFTRITAAVTVIIIEATASMDVLAPIILACVIARAVSMAIVSHSLDERSIIAKGVPFLEHDAHPSTASVKIGDALKEADSRRGPIIAFRKQERLEVLLNALLLTDENAFPVLDDVENNTGLGGLVTRAMLQRVLRIVLETDADTDTDASTSEEAVAKPRRSTLLSSTGRSSWSRKSIDKWCVEGIRSADEETAKVDHLSQVCIDIDGEDERERGSADTSDTDADVTDESDTSSLKTADSSLPPATPKASEGYEFMRSLARWTSRNAKRGLHSLHPTAGIGKLAGIGGAGSVRNAGGTKKNVPRSDVDVPARVGAAAMRSGAQPAFERRGDENHFDELKEGTSIVNRLREGVMNVPSTQLSRMVDLTHAVDKAPWTVDSCMKLARVHALFARLGVRHLCVVSDNGRRLEGIITRHDLIHVHRLAEEGH